MRRLILAMAVMFTAVAGVKAQGAPVIPDDPDVRKGVLPNGMTYYVRHNANPVGQADFYIYHDVGAVQEEDSQIGLAHFLEHMAFNGTTNLPGKQLLTWLESIGVRFGYNLNASTGHDRTTYLVSSVPVSRESIIDSVLLIMHDWSHFIALLPEEIDAERGVISEELRGGNTAGRRLMEKQLPYIYGDDTRYGHRNIIGTLDQLANFPHQEIIDFYHRWYRPDLQAIIVVGDIDPDAVVEKIKTLMADIPAVENAPDKEVVTITPNDEPVIKIFSDPELTATEVELFIGRDKMVPKEMNNTVIAPLVDYAISFVTSALNERLAEITNQPNAPFTSAYAYDYELIPTADIFGATANVKGTDVKTALQVVYTELQRMARYGLTVAEFERVKANIERRIQQTYDGKDDVRNSSYVYRYIANYRDNAAMPDAETKYQTDKSMLDNITREMVNSLAEGLITVENQKVFVTTPDSDMASMPSEDDLAQLITSINDATIEAPAEEVSNIPLIPAKVKLKGSKVSKTTTGQFGETIWTLKNGMRVIVKPTDFKKDEVQLSVYAFGGQSLIGDDMVFAASNLSYYFAQAGLGEFTSTDLRKQLAGKAVSLNPNIGDYTAGFYGSTSPKDMETMLQLLYLHFTAPRWNTDAYNVMIEKLTNQLKGVEADPQFTLFKNLYKSMYNDNPREQLMTVESVSQITFARLQAVWKAIYSNPADFTIELVGNVDLNELKPLVEKYIGSLPKGKAKSKWMDRNVRLAQGDNTNRFQQPMETPKNTIIYMYNGALDYTLQNTLVVEALGQIIGSRYTETIREELGGAYSPQASAGMMDLPVSVYQIMAYVETNADMSAKVEELIVDGLEKIADDGVTAEELQKVKEYLLKEYADDVKLNGYWVGTLRNFYLNGRNFHDGYEDAVNALSSDDIKAFVQKVVADKNIVRVIMEGTAKTAE